MKVRLQDSDVGIRPVTVDSLNAIVIFDDHDQPIAIYMKPASGVIWSRTISDSDFDKVIKDMNIFSRKTECRTVLQLAE